MKNKKWIAFFEDYYLNKLNAADKKEIEGAFRSDPSLKSSYQEFAKAMDSLFHSATRAQMAKNPEFQKAIARGAGSINQGNNKVGIYIGVTILIIISFIAIYLFINSNNEKELPITPETEKISNQKVPIAMINTYLEAADKMEIQLRGFDSSDVIDSAKLNIKENCIALIKREQFELALDCLDKAEEYLKKDEELWFKSLSFLGLGEIGLARQNLLNLASNRFSEYFALSRDLLNDIEQL